jgi:hypothetical protein
VNAFSGVGNKEAGLLQDNWPLRSTLDDPNLLGRTGARLGVVDGHAEAARGHVLLTLEHALARPFLLPETMMA